MLQYEEEQPLLHGTLQVRVFAARDLPDTDNALFNIARGDWTDPFVEVGLVCSGCVVHLCKTAYLNNTINPEWEEETFRVPVCHHAEKIRVNVMDREHIGQERVGSVELDVALLLSGEELEDWWELDTQGAVHLSMQLFPLESLSEGKELDDSYFSPRPGCRVTLYQDADTPQLEVFSGVTEPGGEQYTPPRLWLDLFHALDRAERFIYITGWSVFTGISLVRGEEAAELADTNVGELLKRKAAEGVRVCVMTWNEKSNDTGLIAGIMGTHDEATLEFFRDSEVVCTNVPRWKESWLGLEGQFVGTFYTHHQKIVVCDTEAETGGRRLLGFVGGIDITNGRYDSPEYPLFRTIFGLHAAPDYYQNCTVGTTERTGPREPWHDIHARLEGPVVRDLLQNFLDRWSKQAPDMAGDLLDLEQEEDLDLEGEVEGEDCFTVQLLRSITQDSANMERDKAQVCHRKFGRLIDNSIMRQYVNLIRNASSYIYIENQYFLGSAHTWLADSDTLSYHVIPMEITQKIISKINSGEFFHVYVCIPMYPEGDPASVASQEILCWQFRTMEAMYKRIAVAIEKAGSDTRPTDHLSFYCLGKREGAEDLECVLDQLEQPEPGSGAELVRQSLRHPVYVHSKLMVVDDDYIVVGSANINQRSLAGERDTEICVSASQPALSRRGQIHTFRLALWSAHLGGYSDQFEEPGSVECLEFVRRVTQQFWQLYTAEEPQHSEVHLLPYPLAVTQHGDLYPLEPPLDCFPDTVAPVLGSKSGDNAPFLPLPNKLTT